MIIIDVVALALAKKYTDETFAGSGSLQGKDGKSAYQIALDNGFIGTEADWLESLKGEIGASGEDGYSPSIAESNENTEDIYKLDITTKTTSYTTPNLKGKQGIQGLQGIQGEAGKDGADGTTYTPSIGEVTTVDSNELASATVSVNTETKEAVFNFAIPKGNKGLDSVQISDNETVEDKTWSSKKTSDEIAKVETELNAKVDKKEYYNALDYGNPIIPQDADLNDYLTPGVYTCMSSTIANTLLNCPHIDSNFKLIVNKNRGNDDTLFYGYQMIVGTKGGNPVTDVCVYYRGISVYNNVCVFSKWKIMSGSTVADVPKTTLTPVFPSEVVVASDGVAINYIVRNGWCNVNFVFNITSATTFSWTDIATGLPKPANSVDIVLMNTEGKLNRTIPIQINSTGSVSSRIPTEISTTDWWVGNISYPVAEN